MASYCRMPFLLQSDYIYSLASFNTDSYEYPGAGIRQPARLNGGTDENGNVMMVSDGFMYPDVDQIIKVSIVKM